MKVLFLEFTLTNKQGFQIMLIEDIRGLGFNFVDFCHLFSITSFIQYLMHYYKETMSPCLVFTLFFKKNMVQCT